MLRRSASAPPARRSGRHAAPGTRPDIIPSRAAAQTVSERGDGHGYSLRRGRDIEAMVEDDRHGFEHDAGDVATVDAAEDELASGGDVIRRSSRSQAPHQHEHMDHGDGHHEHDHDHGGRGSAPHPKKAARVPASAAGPPPSQRELRSKRKAPEGDVAAALLDAAPPPRARPQDDDLSGDDEEEEGEGEEGDYRAASELSSPNPHSLFGDVGDDDDENDDDDGDGGGPESDGEGDPEDYMVHRVRRRLEQAPPTPLPPRDAESHTLVNVAKPADRHALPKPNSISAYKNGRPTAWWKHGGKCCACLALAKLEGHMVKDTVDGSRRKEVAHRNMPDTMPSHWAHVAAGACVPEVTTACQQCSRGLKKPVWLCEGCNKEGLCWDHEMAKPAWHRVVVGGGS